MSCVDKKDALNPKVLVSEIFHKRKTGVQLLGSSDGCTPAFLYSDSSLNSFGNF